MTITQARHSHHLTKEWHIFHSLEGRSYWWCSQWLYWGTPPHEWKLTPYCKSTIIVVQLLSHVQLFATPWTATRLASLSLAIFLSLLKLMPIELVMPSNHLILYIILQCNIKKDPLYPTWSKHQNIKQRRSNIVTNSVRLLKWFKII